MPVAVRFVRGDAGGSVVLLRKMLKKYPKPVLGRNATPDAGS